MSSPSQSQLDINTLGWVKSEIDDTLNQARTSLETFVESPDDESQLRFCINYLHQVYGTLQMVELYGAAMVAEEMESVTQALLDNRISNREDAYEILMRGILQLPDYLERLQGGAKDMPVLLLPLLNDLRAARGEALLTENALFQPDLSVEAPQVSSVGEEADSIQQLAKKLRHTFHLGLLGWFKDRDTPGSLEKIQKVVDQLRQGANDAEASRIFWVASGVVEGLRDGGLESSVAVKLLMGNLDRQIKRIIDSGEISLAETPPVELLKNLLYYVSRADSNGETITELKGAFNLKEVLPDAQSIEKARADMTGPNAALMGTVSAVLIDDLTKVKDTLDVFVRTDDKDIETLRELVETLAQMSDTLGMLGLGIQRQEVQNQLDVLSEMVAGNREVEDTALMEVAGALLGVEGALSNLPTARAVNEQAQQAVASGEPEKAVDRKLLQSVVAEARAELAQVKDALNDFSRTPSRAALLKDVPGYLRKIQGSMSMLSLQQAADLMAIANHYIEKELVPGDTVPEDESLEVLADAISSIEYYLESLVEGWGHPEAILQVAQQSLTQLGVVTDTNMPADAAGSNAAPQLGDVGESDLINQTLDNLEAPDLGGLSAPGSADPNADTLVDLQRPTKGVSTQGDDETTISLDHPDSDSALNELEQTLVDIPLPDMSLEERDGAASEEFKFEAEPVGDGLTLEGFDSDTAIELGGSDLSDIDLAGMEVGQPDEANLAETELTPAVEEVTPSRPISPPAASVIEEIDEEILEIFLEEAEEEHGNITRLYPKWQANPADEESLLEMRRSFHTLKGSGRLVGAVDVGEFAWACENMLNRIIDKTIEPTPVMHALMERVQQVLPELFDGFRNSIPTGHEVFNLMDIAHAISQGKEVSTDALEKAREEKTSAEKSAEEPVHGTDKAEAEPSAQASAPLQEEEPQGFFIPAIDPGLCEIYRNETEVHLQTLREFIFNAQENNQMTADQILVRALHTLSGSSRTTGMQPLAELSGLFEKYTKQRESANLDLHPQAIEVLEDYVEFVAEAAGKIEQVGTPLAEPETLRDRIQALYELAVSEEVAPPSASVEPTPEFQEESAAHEYDDELLDIFLEEGVEILEESDHTLHDWINDRENKESVEALQRQLHTLKGGARMAGVTEIGDLSHSMESLLTAVVDGQLVASQPMFDTLLRAQDRLVHMLEQLKLRQTMAPAEEIIADLENLLRHPPQPSEAGEPVEETDLDMPQMESIDFEQVSEEPDFDLGFEAPTEVDLQAPTIDEHAQAGAASEELEIAEDATAATEVVELEPESEAAPEPQIEAVADETPATVMESESDAAAEASDMETEVAGTTDNVVSFEPKSPIEPVSVEAEEDKAEREEQAENTSELTDSVVADAVEVEDDTTGEVDEAEVADIAVEVVEAADKLAEQSEPMVQAEEESVPEPEVPKPTDEPRASAMEMPVEVEREQPVRARPQGEQVRVRSELLDNLVNFAGEVSIYRSRLEQQNNTFRFNLVELDDTVTRLRDQLRNFEIEAETQIQFRYENATGRSYEEFDPLEFDRFTMMQQLSRGMLESLSDLDSLRNILGNLTRESETLLLQQSRINTELQEGLMRTRMVPFSSQVARLRRIVRQTCQELDKQAELHIHGMESELDRTVLERILAPIEHMLRNAIAHGIESPVRRRELGKKETGQLNINLVREGNDLVINMTDDGAGINLEAIQAQAIDRGLIDPDAHPSKDELLELIMESGFSTASEVTQIAGRGVGMDVVNNEITRLGGLLNIETGADKGTQFSVRLPQSLSVARALLVHVADETYAIPLLGVEGVERVDMETLNQLQQSESKLYKWVGEDYRYIHLGSLLGHSMQPTLEEERNMPLLLVRSGDFRAAIQVDGLIGSREVVVKPVGPQLSTLRGISGATIMGDGSVILILDLGVLIRLTEAQITQVEEEVQAPIEQEERLPLIMVVDDSITVRKVTSRLLERNEMQVITAKDGVDALAQLHDVRPDVMLLDIEMPRMDGFELATNMRNDAGLKRIPIIMITSRTGEKHRERALSIGVNQYMGKPYQEAELISNIQQLLDESQA